MGKPRALQALNDWVDRTIPADDPDSHVILTGDLNTFEFTNDLTEILPGQRASGS